LLKKLSQILSQLKRSRLILIKSTRIKKLLIFCHRVRTSLTQNKTKSYWRKRSRRSKRKIKISKRLRVMKKYKRVSVSSVSRKPLKDATIVVSSTVEGLTWRNTKTSVLILFILFLCTRDLKKKFKKLESLTLIFWLRFREIVLTLRTYSLTTSTMNKLNRLCLGEAILKTL
jgi:hypothetical protein